MTVFKFLYWCFRTVLVIWMWDMGVFTVPGGNQRSAEIRAQESLRQPWTGEALSRPTILLFGKIRRWRRCIFSSRGRWFLGLCSWVFKGLNALAQGSVTEKAPRLLGSTPGVVCCRGDDDDVTVFTGSCRWLILARGLWKQGLGVSLLGLAWLYLLPFSAWTQGVFGKVSTEAHCVRLWEVSASPFYSPYYSIYP